MFDNLILLVFSGVWADVEMMKERFSKLLLGEDMSGCGTGVSTSLAISNAITNLCGMLCPLFFFFLQCLDDGIQKFHDIGFFLVIVIALSFPQFPATLFGQLWRLEPLPAEKKAMWRREMEWLLCVSDHIVELIPSWQTFPDGSKLEVTALAI